MSETEQWNARRILFDLCDPELRIKVLSTFWKKAEEPARHAAVMRLAKTLHFREQTLRKTTAEKKAEWLASRLHIPELGECADMALMLYHTHDRRDLLAAFLDAWEIPHQDGSIEDDNYKVPTEDQVRVAATSLTERFGRESVRLYLASAGLLMGDEWQKATWPVVNTMMNE